MSVLRRLARRRTGGQALVEFTIVLPLIVVLVLGALDLGRAVYSYNTLSQSARTASRTALVNQDVATVKSSAIASAATLGLTTTNVAVCFKAANTSQTNCAQPTVDDCPSTTRQVGCLAIVVVSLSYQPMTPVISVFFNTIPLTATSIVAIEYVCPPRGLSTCS